MPEPFGRRSLLGMLAGYAALVLATFGLSLAATCAREPAADAPRSGAPDAR